MTEKFVPSVQQIKESVLFQSILAHEHLMPYSLDAILDGLCAVCLQLGALEKPSHIAGRVKLYQPSINSAFTWSNSPPPYSDTFWREIFKAKGGNYGD